MLDLGSLSRIYEDLWLERIWANVEGLPNIAYNLLGDCSLELYTLCVGFTDRDPRRIFTMETWYSLSGIMPHRVLVSPTCTQEDTNSILPQYATVKIIIAKPALDQFNERQSKTCFAEWRRFAHPSHSIAYKYLWSAHHSSTQSSTTSNQQPTQPIQLTQPTQLHHHGFLPQDLSRLFGHGRSHCCTDDSRAGRHQPQDDHPEEPGSSSTSSEYHHHQRSSHYHRPGPISANNRRIYRHCRYWHYCSFADARHASCPSWRQK